MSSYTAIEDAGITLLNLLKNNMKDMGDIIPPESIDTSIVLGSPGKAEEMDGIRISLFLYQIIENIHLKNQEMQRIGISIENYPPISLDLYYMLTAHPGTQNQRDITESTKQEHRILGRAIQILHDNSTVKMETIDPDIKEEWHIVLNPLSLDDMTKIWTTFQGKSMRPSVCYLVTPIQIHSEREKIVQRVVSKEMGHYYRIPE
ncbi:MAG: DUF4255 domain-containing protein [ANME-2 cluster archaeon]|nr:MAG: DUF4255 domain-containing protein [ANME-2 cluster archaeon]